MTTPYRHIFQVQFPRPQLRSAATLGCAPENKNFPCDCKLQAPESLESEIRANYFPLSQEHSVKQSLFKGNETKSKCFGKTLQFLWNLHSCISCSVTAPFPNMLHLFTIPHPVAAVFPQFSLQFSTCHHLSHPLRVCSHYFFVKTHLIFPIRIRLFLL